MNKNLLNVLLNISIVIALASYFAYTKGWILADFDSISPTEAQKIIQADTNITIVDVRTPEEFSAGHVEHARSIPLSNLEETLTTLPKNEKILVYCQSGNRSVSASRLLSAKGFTPLNIKGGINAWNEAGYPLIR